MQRREISEGILKRCRNEGIKVIVLIEIEFKNRDQNGGIYKVQKEKRVKIWERILVIDD